MSFPTVNDTSWSRVRTIWTLFSRISFAVLFANCCQFCEAAEPPIASLAFSPDGKSVLTVSQTGVQVFSWPALERLRNIEVSAANFHSLRFSPSGKMFAIAGGDPAEQGSVELFSWPEAKSIAIFDEHEDSVMSVVWLDDQRIASASRDLRILIRNVKDATSMRQLAGHSRSVDAVCVLADGKTLVSSGVDHSVRVWSLETGKLIRSLTQHTKPIHALAVRPGNSGLPMVASAAADRTIRFWQPTIGRMVRYIRLEAEPLDVAWTKDGEQILAACVDGKVRVVDPVEVKVKRTIDAIEGWAYGIAVHPKDKTVAVGGSNGQIKRLEVENSSDN